VFKYKKDLIHEIKKQKLYWIPHLRSG